MDVGVSHAMTAFPPMPYVQSFSFAVQYPVVQAYRDPEFIVCQMGCEMYTAHNGIMQVVHCFKNNLSIILPTISMGFPFIQIRKSNFSF